MTTEQDDGWVSIEIFHMSYIRMDLKYGLLVDNSTYFLSKIVLGPAQESYRGEIMHTIYIK
jgi:hypothetical protein